MRVPWDEEHVFYVWYDALVNYVTAIGYGEDEERFDAWWPAVHHLIGKEIIRFHCVWWPAMCMAAGIDPPAHVQVHGWLLLGGEKMSNSSVNQIAPGELTAEYGVDPVRYHLLRDMPARAATGSSPPRGSRPATTPTWPTTSATCCPRVATVVGLEVRRGRPGAPARTAGWPGWPPTWWPRRPTAWDAAPAPPGPRGHVAAHPRDQRRAGDGRAVEGRAGPGGRRVLGSALEVLRIVSILIVPAMPSTGGEIWRRIGLTGSPEDQRLPAAAAWGATRGAGPWRRAHRCSPGARTERVAGRDAVIEWFDSHCHLQDEFAEAG